MSQSLSTARRNLLVRLESMLGNECYNANIQNYGPGGVREADGRSFRYPLTLRAKDSTKIKVRETSVPASVSNDRHVFSMRNANDREQARIAPLLGL